MKTARRPSRPQRLIGLVQLCRIRLSVAENTVESARELARLARRRRKEAKQAARRAKKQLKRAKEEVATARQSLVDAEAKLARSTARVESRKRGSPKSVRSSATRGRGRAAVRRRPGTSAGRRTL